MEDINEVLDWAKELSNRLPDKYQKSAFEILLQYKLNGIHGKLVNLTEEYDKSVIIPNNEKKVLEDWEVEIINNLPNPESIIKSNFRQKQALWAVIELLKENKEATVDEIRNTIRRKLGIKPQVTSNLCKTLSKLEEMGVLTREKKDDTKLYIYYPTIEAKHFFGEN